MTKDKKDTIQQEDKKDGKKNKTEIPELKSGMTVRVHERIVEIDTKGKAKERIQIFEGIILGIKKQKTQSATFTIRKVSSGIGVEKIFPLKSPLIEKIEVVKQIKVRRAKLNYLRDYKKRLRIKKK